MARRRTAADLGTTADDALRAALRIAAEVKDARNARRLSISAQASAGERRTYGAGKRMWFDRPKPTDYHGSDAEWAWHCYRYKRNAPRPPDTDD